MWLARVNFVRCRDNRLNWSGVWTNSLFYWKAADKFAVLLSTYCRRHRQSAATYWPSLTSNHLQYFFYDEAQLDFKHKLHCESKYGSVLLINITGGPSASLTGSDKNDRLHAHKLFSTSSVCCHIPIKSALNLFNPMCFYYFYAARVQIKSSA